MTTTAAPKALLPVDWKHADFASALKVSAIVADATDALWDTDSPDAALGLLNRAERIAVKEIGSKAIRQSWLARIDWDRECAITLFA